MNGPMQQGRCELLQKVLGMVAKNPDAHLVKIGSGGTPEPGADFFNVKGQGQLRVV